MSDYKKIRPEIFTEDGQLMFLKIRDRSKALIKNSGAAMLGHIISNCTGDSWLMMACVDRLVEIGELTEIKNSDNAWAQHRLFIEGRQ